MNIVFLDIDGVLNSRSMEKDDVVLLDGWRLSRRKINILNSFTKITESKIVLSSVWRDFEDIDNKLKDCGLEAEIIGHTPHGGRMSVRGNEIHQWLKDNEKILGTTYYYFHNYVIFDDDSDMLLWQKENFFACDNSVGITENVTYRARMFLERTNSKEY